MASGMSRTGWILAEDRKLRLFTLFILNVAQSSGGCIAAAISAVLMKGEHAAGTTALN